MTRSSAPTLRPYASAAVSFADGRDSPRDFLERCLEAIAEWEPRIHALAARVDLAELRREADEASARYRGGCALSPVDGMPIGIKDIIDTADMPTAMGSPLYEGHRPLADAACVRALRRAGALVAAKTVTTEFACGASGPTRNPHDVERTPGGSSSGSGASVGCGMLPAALGTQTRASTIRPASFNGAFGYKPSFGALNLGGVHPVSTSQDHLGVIAASLEDTWALSMAIARGAGACPGHAPLAGPVEPPAPAPPARIALVRTQGWDELDTPTQESFERALERLSRADPRLVVAGRGADPAVEAVEEAIRDADLLSRTIIGYEMAAFPYGDLRERHGAVLGAPIRAYLDLADGLRARDYAALWERRDAIVAGIDALLSSYDAIVTLASSGPAPHGLEATGSRLFLTPWTLAGLPAISLPLLESGGLPVGLQMVGARGADAALFARAAAVRDAVPARA